MKKRFIKREGKRHMLQSSKGFTLMEMLIVVAIIAVLVAVSIPIFANSLNKSKESVCKANCRSLKALLTSAYMSGEDINKVYTNNIAEYTCPLGGTITYEQDEDTGVITVLCSHNGEGGNALDTLTSNVKNAGNSLKDAYYGYFGTNNNGFMVDSSALSDPNSKASAFFNSLTPAQQNILKDYAWSIGYTNTGSGNALRLYFASNAAIEAAGTSGKFDIYKYDPVTGLFQYAPDGSTTNSKLNVGSSNWGYYVDGVWQKGGWGEYMTGNS